jgi:two-component system, LytTR family, response regulator
LNTKLRCLLLDDELPGLSYLRTMCEQIPDVEVVRAFNDPVKFIEESPRLEFDFCIMDVEMPQLNGLEVAKQVGAKPIIFTTAYKEYAAEAFDIDAVDYIRKPIERERLERAIQKAADRLGKKAPEKLYMQLNTNKGKTLLYFNKILFITNSEIDKRDKLAELESGERLVLKNISFEQLLAELPEKDFCRVNKKHIIALRNIKSYTHDQIVLFISGKDSVMPLGDNFRKNFLVRIK